MYKEKIRARFNELASSYSDRSISFTLNKRLERIKKYNTEGDKVLEIGCGSGDILSSLRGDRYGIDISTKMVCVAKERISNAEFANSDSEFLPFKDHVFDAIIISEVLYYLESNEMIIKESYRCLREGGTLLITSLSKPWWFLKKLVNLLKIGVHDNVSLEYPGLDELRLMIEIYFKIKEVNGIPFWFLPKKISPIFFIAAKK